MEKKRIGKTLKIRWSILTGGEPEPLAGRDLTLENVWLCLCQSSYYYLLDYGLASLVDHYIVADRMIIRIPCLPEINE